MRLLLSFLFSLVCLTSYGQGAKIQWATTNTGSTLTNITKSLGTNAALGVLSNSPALFYGNSGADGILVFTNASGLALTLNNDAAPGLHFSGDVFVGDGNNSIYGIFNGNGAGLTNLPTVWRGVSNTATSGTNVIIANNQTVIQNGGANTLTVTNGNVTIAGYSTATKGFGAQTKAEFSTNYTCSISDTVLFCVGTNQVITLPNGTNATTPPGKIICIISASTTGSVIVTNFSGSQTIFGSLSVSIPATNSITVVNSPLTGNWW